MGYLILKRIAAAIPVMLVVATIVFFLLRLSPGDPAMVLAGDMASPQEVAQIRARLGLDQPLLIQYVTWLGEMARGNFGVSILSKRPVMELIMARLEPTFVLALCAIVLTVLLAVPLGRRRPGITIAGSTAGSWRCRCWASRSRPSSSATC